MWGCMKTGVVLQESQSTAGHGGGLWVTTGDAGSMRKLPGWEKTMFASDGG